VRPAAVALIAVVAVAAAGCLGDEERRTVPSGNVTADLERARAVQPPLYYAGPRVAELDLTAVSMTSQPRATFFYGTCELPAGEGGCSPPIQIQHIPFSSAAWRRAEGCRALEPIRDVPAARHDGLVLFTGGRVLKVYARSTAEERRIALALRPVAGGGAGAPLPHPTAAVRALVARVCR
jgi:hypothetical protein